jgi:hypothetical protein
MKYLRIFIAGITFPSILLPFLLCAALMLGKSQILTIPVLHFIPLIWGVWNVLYFLFFRKILPGNATVRFLLAGAILGLLVAIYGVFWLNMPEILGLPKSLDYLPLILGPVIYAIVWLFIVKPLNALLDIKEK